MPRLALVFCLALLSVACGADRNDRKGTSTLVAQLEPADFGALEHVDCDTIAGWAHDSTVPDATVAVELTFDSPLVDGADGAVAADQHRNDLCSTVGCEHGFSLAPPYSLYDEQSHFVFAYANDIEEQSNVELPGSPLTFTCAPPAVTGIKRPIPNAATTIEWRFDPLWHEVASDDATIESLPSGTVVPGKPILARADDGTPAIWLIEGDLRRSVPQPAAMINWRFDPEAVETRPAAELYAMTQGPPLRTRPMLVRTSYDEVFLVDDGTAEPSTPGLPEPEEGDPTYHDTPVDHDDSQKGTCAARIATGSTRDGGRPFVLAFAVAAFLTRTRRRRARP